MPKPISPTADVLNAFADSIDKSLKDVTGKRHGFVLVIFDLEAPRAHYVGNVDRAQSIEALKDLLERLHVPLAPPQGGDPANN